MAYDNKDTLTVLDNTAESLTCFKGNCGSKAVLQNKSPLGAEFAKQLQIHIEPMTGAVEPLCPVSDDKTSSSGGSMCG